ncbi:nucleoside diphosphate-linked moiety X motif 19 [Caerostris extrusa]|uniref:Nucleoside diphosphate-linked moiety X motif 19 n=1 Tax=Caerostris extrusa TaxID=172846 RepID=A0AAV4P4K2_CAEEX|nr:nucleoside diphosphate-linked moiety X motif 19 [Caerostris extrusa]
MFRNLRRLSCIGTSHFKKPHFWIANSKITGTLNHFNNRKYSNSAEMDNPPWREASTLIIASRLTLHDVVAKGKNLSNLMSSATRNYNNKPTTSDYRLLMVKRSGLSSFMANAYVFPGGLVEVADYSPLWWSVFEKLGITRRELLDFCSNIQGERPPMITTPITLKSKGALPNEDYLPPDIGLRIAALRETFEETGILLLTNPSLETTQEATTHTLLTHNVDIQAWQKRIHDDPYAFLDLCLESHMCPDIWSLYEWSDWLTPTAVGHRRYDTMFYLCCLPRQPDVLLDKGEVTIMRWCSPDEMMSEHFTNSIFLAPPQVYELSRLMLLQSYHELRNFAKKREPEGCERWMPIISTAIDGAVSYLPGDDLYPKEPDFEGIQKPIDFPYALDDLRAKSKLLHRMEIRGPQCTTYCNITPNCGHLQPLTYKLNQPIVQSFL